MPRIAIDLTRAEHGEVYADAKSEAMNPDAFATQLFREKLAERRAAKLAAQAVPATEQPAEQAA